MTSWPALIAIDLGAESCRVSLLQWREKRPFITMVKRFANRPIDFGSAGLRWDLEHICKELEAGLRACATLAPNGIASIGVTGWAVDYVRLDRSGSMLSPPYCYRDRRTTNAMEAVHRRIPATELYAKTGVQIQTLNTIYQLYADHINKSQDNSSWVNLPEYILHSLGAPRVAEYTNATHTGLIDAESRTWSDEIFSTLGLNPASRPELVDSGTVLGLMRGPLTELASFRATRLIAPACHDTASAVAGLPADISGPWVYISSGTWSLVGTILSHSVLTQQAFARGFTNLGATGGNILFHRGIPGMWLLRQCMNVWAQTRNWTLSEVIARAVDEPPPDALLDLDDPAFDLPGDMTVRINRQRHGRGLPAISESHDAAPRYANLIFHSLASRYSSLLGEIEMLTGKVPERLFIIGGGSRNEYLNMLTTQIASVPVTSCSAESSTLGNMAVQLARCEQPNGILTAQLIAEKAAELADAQIQGREQA